MGQSFVRVNRVIGEKKRFYAFTSKAESLFFGETRSKSMSDRTPFASADSVARPGRSSWRRALRLATRRCVRGVPTGHRPMRVGGGPRPVSRATKASARSTFCLGGRALVPLTGADDRKRSRVWVAKGGVHGERASGVPQAGGVRQSQPRGAHAFPHGRGAVGAVARHGRVWSCEAEKRKRLLLERDARCAVW